MRAQVAGILLYLPISKNSALKAEEHVLRTQQGSESMTVFVLIISRPGEASWGSELTSSGRSFRSFPVLCVLRVQTWRQFAIGDQVEEKK